MSHVMKTAQRGAGDPVAQDDRLALFDRQNVRFVILNLLEDNDLVRLLRSRPEWTVDFEDADAVIFARAA
jgi:hypothetical protein